MLVSGATSLRSAADGHQGVDPKNSQVRPSISRKVLDYSAPQADSCSYDLEVTVGIYDALQ